ncbi:hypothetical protein [Stenomitos frigidus]|uniref:Uncharacterized protein n=1 Tax=Stenomitos frigidus ULC18 TaxID=2107698 RepID=A0A2T1EMF8_9CYAN|nr:hypothetical protein [Stenomitos frigidus]PSB33927.1 hypothetical protein C7B82_03430 [Stenomitos frigidus ULC18]
MDTFLTILFQRCSNGFLEAVNAVSFNLLQQRERIIWEDTHPRARWRYFTVRRHTLPAPAGTATTATTRARRLPTSRLVLLATLLVLLGSWLSRALGRVGCPTIYLQPVPHRPGDTVDFSLPSDHESPSPQSVKPTTTRPTPAKPGTHPSTH